MMMMDCGAVIDFHFIVESHQNIKESWERIRYIIPSLQLTFVRGCFVRLVYHLIPTLHLANYDYYWYDLM